MTMTIKGNANNMFGLDKTSSNQPSHNDYSGFNDLDDDERDDLEPEDGNQAKEAEDRSMDF